MEINTDWIEMLSTDQILTSVHDLDLLHNNWFIAGAVLFVIVSLMMKWHMLLACTLSLTGLIVITSLVHQQGTDVSKSSDGLFIFIGGGAVIVFFLIYMVFMRGD
ncbi:MAG: hypothetical protein J7K75_11425 [Desulfuromonas sp.]|nr:hypothetical protein [Desulfuromonas sp.]